MENEAEVLEGEFEPDDPKDILRQAREMIPVGATGTAPMNLAQQVDFARDMSKANVSIPDHLKKSVGDCLAIIDISTRAGLSPFMVANKTYVQKGRLCFESQLYHAFAQSSGLLKGDLTVDYEGEGDELVCIVTGFLRADPLRPRVHRSEPLKKAHPGHSEKDGKTFVRGSPLWDRKPRVQLFYDCSRDWVRIYCPRATLGIYTPDEIEEYGPDFARDVTPTLRQRLTGSAPSPEGHREGHAVRELDQIVGAGQVIEHDQPKAAEAKKPAGGKVVAPEPDKRTTDRPRGRPKGSTTRTKPEAEPEGGKSRATRLSEEIDMGIKSVHTIADYLAYAKRWIKACTDNDEMFVRWTREKDKRNAVGMTSADREPLDLLIAKRRNELGEK